MTCVQGYERVESLDIHSLDTRCTSLRRKFLWRFCGIYFEIFWFVLCGNFSILNSMINVNLFLCLT